MAAHSGQLPSRQPSPPLVPPLADMRPAPVSRSAVPTPAQTTFTPTPAPLGPPEASRPAHALTLQRPNPDPQGLVPGIARNHTDTALSGETSEQENQTKLTPNRRPRTEEQDGLLDVSRAQNIGYLEVVANRARGSSTPATVVAQSHEPQLLEPTAPAPAAPLTTQELMPTIKITIGRVDVRAIMPAAPAPRPTPARPGPGLSLEDYLKQREGRRR
jgi:hypothetical protein